MAGRQRAGPGLARVALHGHDVEGALTDSLSGHQAAAQLRDWPPAGLQWAKRTCNQLFLCLHSVCVLIFVL
jgi:hypothetical protein